MSSVDGSVVGHGELDLQHRHGLERHQILDVRAPFALPKGRFTATISGHWVGGIAYELTVRGSRPVLLDTLGPR